ncbi:NADH oxidase [Zhongshania aliphaticivorans]|uniref:NADH oxidase n=1 Tax=Zhongshania aliphaticivorans TaxID=1470434 RepID=A0A5S9QHR5_9GAMM|nr:NADH:flavin oxidoreductase [Zhongshania aliphaticivorans]CAA0110682.1 NADH oxidase [Zhongshania aliphaticivorans]CAA0118250.1 NADH oxidase [Zhongshania aliphaticivorans]CAA0122270.1 NADH oxidase [Zhongshania aliphaticivorans]
MLVTSNLALTSANLNGLTLKNRLIKAGTFENLSPNGTPSQGLLDFHKQFAVGGVAMTTIGYCAVENAGRLNANMLTMHEDFRKEISQLVKGIQSQGCKVSGQMGHCGAFSKNHTLKTRPKGPSGGLNILGIAEGMWFCDAMTLSDIDHLVDAYRNAAIFMKSVGFDALEIHFGHGYGLCQFLSPLTNKRKDIYGGSLENRLRLPLRVLAAVRAAVGNDFPILGKISMSEGPRTGISYEDSISICKALDEAGIDAIIASNGTSTMNPMLMFRGDSILPSLLKYEKNRLMRFILRLMGKKMFPSLPFYEMYLLEQAKRIREVVKCKMVYIGGASNGDNFTQILDSGFDFIQLGRTLLADPDLPQKLAAKPHYKSRCTHCNQCVGTIESPQGIHCPPFFDGSRT